MSEESLTLVGFPAPWTVARAVAAIDADADAIYGTVQGNRVEEYRTAEAEASAYKQAGYPPETVPPTGAVPPSVQSWATAKAWTTQVACDDILNTATLWRGAQAQIRAKRLRCKELARAAGEDPQALSLVMADWHAFVAQMRVALGLPAA